MWFSGKLLGGKEKKRKENSIFSILTYLLDLFFSGVFLGFLSNQTKHQGLLKEKRNEEIVYFESWGCHVVSFFSFVWFLLTTI